MVDTLSSQPASPGRGLAARIIGVLTSPRATYADVAAHPRWLGVLIVVLATTIAAASLVAFDGGRPAGGDRPAAADARGVRPDRHRRAIPADGADGAVLDLLRRRLPDYLHAARRAGDRRYRDRDLQRRPGRRRQLQAGVRRRGVFERRHRLRALFATPLNYARESLSSPTTLTAVLPFFEDNTFAAGCSGRLICFSSGGS